MGCNLRSKCRLTRRAVTGGTTALVPGNEGCPTKAPAVLSPTREAKCSDSWALEAKRGVWASPTFPTLCFFGGREAPSEIRETESAQHTAYIRKHMLFGVSLLAAARICATTAAIQHGGETEIAEQGQQCVMSQAPNTGYLTLLIRSRSTS